MHVFFSVGEPSGDQHAANLIRELKTQDPELSCSGYGGEEMQAAGCRIDYPLTNLAVMGVFQVLPMLWTFIRLLRQTRKLLAARRPDVVVLVDFPGFNWWVARHAKRLGIRVVYYMPPQLWAWGGWRIKRVKRYVDEVLCPLPFEYEWYRRRGINARYVGHPFFDEVRAHPVDATVFDQQIPAGTHVVGILPGSRNHEVHRSFPQFLRILKRVHPLFPDTQFLVACYKPRHEEYCRQLLDQTELAGCVRLCVGQTSEVIERADFAVMVSGSVSLELLARTTPAIVTYPCSFTFYWLARLLLQVTSVTLPNLIAGRLIMPEHPVVGAFGRGFEDLDAEVEAWLRDPQLPATCRTELLTLASDAIQTGASQRAAAAVLDGQPAEVVRRAA